MMYTWKVRFLKTRRGNVLWRYWKAWRGYDVGNYAHLEEYIRRYAPGHSFVDVGCMWGVDGEHAFLAEAVGAKPVKGVLWLANRALVTLLFTFFSPGKCRPDLRLYAACPSFGNSLGTPPKMLVR